MTTSLPPSTATPAPEGRATTPTISRWANMAFDAPMPLLERRRVIGQQCMVSHVTLVRGCVVASHSHVNEQVSCVLSGRLRFTLEGRTAEVASGEVLYLPSHAPHGAEALEDTVVLDVFAPPSATTGIDKR